MVEHLQSKVNATALIGVGAAFDFPCRHEVARSSLDAATCGAGMAIPLPR